MDFLTKQFKYDRKYGNISETQKKTLISIMEKEDALRCSKFSTTFTHEIARNKWLQIEKQLNAIPGAQKDWTHWKRTWQDLKRQVKKKNSTIKKYQRGTGGGPAVNSILTNSDETILKILDTTSIEGDSSVLESIVPIFEYPEVTENPTYSSDDHDYIPSTYTDEIEVESLPVSVIPNKPLGRETVNMNWLNEPSSSGANKQESPSTPLSTKPNTFRKPPLTNNKLRRQHVLSDSINASKQFVRLSEKKYRVRKIIMKEN